MMTNPLPVELQNIKPPSSPQDCVTQVSYLIDPKNDREKYTLHLARQYFRDNFFLFSKNEFIQMSKNPKFIRRFEHKYATEIMLESIEKQTPLPLLHSGWLTLNITDELKEKYLELINACNNKEQLRIFHTHNKYLVSQKFFEKTSEPSESLLDIILEESPQRVLTLRCWDHNQICNWLSINKDKTKEILTSSNFSVSYRNVHPKVRQQIYVNLLNIFSENKQILNDDNAYIYDTFIRFPHEYLMFAKENYPVLFNHLLKERIIDPKNKHLTMNGIQYVLIERSFNKLEEITELFESHKELVLTEATLKLDIYTSYVHPFELAIKQKALPLFAVFSLQDDLEEAEKDMLVACAFMSMRNKYTEIPKYTSDKIAIQAKKNRVMLDWHDTIISDSTLEQFNEYSTEVTKTIDNKELLIELQALQLSKELNKNLPNNLKIGKKAKI